MKIALIQMEVLSGQMNENRQKSQDLIEQAAPSADVLVLPELWLCGYSLKGVQDFAETKSGQTLVLLKKLAKRYSVHIITGSLPYREEQQVYNAVFHIDRQGEIKAQYSKVHLFSLYKEEKFFAPGPTVTTMPLENFQAGLAICYDLRFPELFRTMALAGAHIIFVPAEWPKVRGSHWLTLAQARAVENQVYVCAVNCVGQHKGDTFYGHSLLISPDGSILAEGSEQEEILSGEIFIEEVQKARENMSILADRRKELYQL